MPRASLNEIEAMARKAARGAGMSWGLAEETGKATRWLALHGLPSLSALVALLARQDAVPYDAIRPREMPSKTAEGPDIRRWQAQSGALCPIATGAALADLAATISGARQVKLHALDTPVLLLPFLARAARYAGHGYALEIEGHETIRLYPDGPDLSDAPALDARGHAVVRACLKPRRYPPPTPEVSGIEVADDLWTRAEAFAHRTYVPASDASRIAGAGAGLSDND